MDNVMNYNKTLNKEYTQMWWQRKYMHKKQSKKYKIILTLMSFKNALLIKSTQFQTSLNLRSQSSRQIIKMINKKYWMSTV